MDRELIGYYIAGTIFALLQVIAIISYAFLNQKKVVELRIKLHNEELYKQQAIFDALQEGQELERTRLAQELHDGVGAKLSGLKMNLEYLKLNTTEHTELVAKVYSGVSETLEEVRAVSHNLMPYVFSGKDMEQLLLHCIEQFNALEGCRYSLLIGTPVTAMDETIKMHVYRMVAELLNNIHKHAKATIASVQVNEEQGKLEIVVEDNGIGMQEAPANAAGIGLKNIGNRVNICKGLLNMDSSEKGTTVMIEIPLNMNV
jgi:two-component system NarL family sensor kinase